MRWKLTDECEKYLKSIPGSEDPKKRVISKDDFTKFCNQYNNVIWTDHQCTVRDRSAVIMIQ